MLTNEQLMRKVLIVSYEFPPLGGIGVQRVLKFVKYLPQYGWQPVVLTPKSPQYWVNLIDESLLSEIPKEAKVYRTFSIEREKIFKAVEKFSLKILRPFDKLLFKERKLESAFLWRLRKFIPDNDFRSFFLFPDGRS
nr:hypothetical protein [Candidatus Bathyarchaeota archaeon]